MERGTTPARAAGPAEVQRALSALRSAASAAALIERAARELVVTCGFDRAVVFRVDTNELVAEAAYFAGQPDEAAHFLELARDLRPRLDHRLLETDAVRRPRPLLVHDAVKHPLTYKPLVLAARVRSYVAAPVAPGGHSIGLIHCDKRLTERDVDEHDRDLLWAFAEGFGYALEGMLLKARLASGGLRLRELAAAADGMADDMAFGRARVEQPTWTIASPLDQPAPDPEIGALLTRRELEVPALIAAGATNVAIGERLVISISTVKSHVKHILRKLHASNRAEAAARYLRVAAVDGERVTGAATARGDGNEPRPAA